MLSQAFSLLMPSQSHQLWLCHYKAPKIRFIQPDVRCLPEVLKLEFPRMSVEGRASLAAQEMLKS